MRAARFRATGLLLLLLLALAGGCDHGPKAGAVFVKLSGPAAVRSAEIRVVGPVTSVQAGDPAVRLFTSQTRGDTLLLIVVAAQGQTLGTKVLAELEVADKDAARGYATRVLQVAAADYSLQVPTAYAVSVSH